MNIGVMKQGKAIIFNKDKWSPIGGDNEPSAFIYLLAKSYPQHTFWILNKGDYYKTFQKPLLPNIKNIWDPIYWKNGINPNTLTNLPFEESEEQHFEYYNYIVDALNRINVKLDFMFAFGGIHFSCSRMQYGKRSNDETVWTRTLEAAYKYQSFQNQYIDDVKPLYAVINTDPRHATGCHPKDLVHMPFVYLSQINKIFKFNVTTKFYPKGVKFLNWKNEHKNVYAGVETIQMLHKEPKHDVGERHGFAMILNQGIPGNSKTKNIPPRYIELKKYILSDPDFACDIYGKWNDDILASDARFKGPISPTCVEEKLANIKYTLCIPIQSGWATAKFTEMAACGVIPFVTNDYASEADVDYIHDFLRVSNAKELKQKIEQIDNDDQLYKGIRLWLKNKLETMYTGDYLFEKMLPILNEKIDFGKRTIIQEPVVSLYKKDYNAALISKLKVNNNQDDLFA